MGEVEKATKIQTNPFIPFELESMQLLSPS